MAQRQARQEPGCLAGKGGIPGKAAKEFDACRDDIETELTAVLLLEVSRDAEEDAGSFGFGRLINGDDVK